MTAPLRNQPVAASFVVPYGIGADLPPESPLPFQPQDFSRPFTDEAAPRRSGDCLPGQRRAGVMLATVSLTVLFTWQMALVFAAGGLTVLEYLALVFYVLTFVWIAFALVNALLGAVMLTGGKDEVALVPDRRLRVALLVLTCNEPPATVFGGAMAMLSSITEAQSRHCYELFVLSDTNRPESIGEEQAAFRAARMHLGSGAPFYYRRRTRNSERKVGNIANWVHRWGGAYDAFLVLDSDSIMDARAIQMLTDELALDDSLGLVQSVTFIIGARTLFARIQQFASAAIGPVGAAGTASWMGTEANYFGHNAILRTRAFAASAGLPTLIGKPPFGGSILSHDFVEAAMLRRAGWGVRLVVVESGSYEETPPSLIDHVLRDRRWCQGNLQHLLVLSAAELHRVSRFHLFHGIMAYLVSPLWAMFLLSGVAVDAQGEGSVNAERGLAVLVGTIVILLAPKLIGLVRLVVTHDAKHGGRLALVGSAFLEIVLTSIVAPIMMVQQTIAVLRVFVGIDGGWCPQRRDQADRPWSLYFRFHAAETALGVALAAPIVDGQLSGWLAPIAASLLFAAPLSRLSSVPLGEKGHLPLLLATPEKHVPTIVAQSAENARRVLEHAQAPPARHEMLQAAE